MKHNIDKQLLLDINHLISWYQGRDVDRCDNVERWVDETANELKFEEAVQNRYKGLTLLNVEEDNDMKRLSGLKNYSQWGWMMEYCKENNLTPANSVMWERAREAYDKRNDI